MNKYEELRPYSRRWIACAGALVLASMSILEFDQAFAASHREAPLTALDHKADITDFFAFVSYDDPSKVTLIVNVDPLLEPANGPNYFPFDPRLLYAIKIDNNFDAVEDIVFEFSFKTELRLPGVFTGFVGAGDGIPAPANSPAPIAPGSAIVPPAITALDGSGSEGLGLRQNYTVTLVRGQQRTLLNGGRTLYAVPSNVGPRTMPDYAGLAEQGIYPLDDGVSVFAGTVEDPFWIDLGAAFDSLNFRADAFDSGIPGVLSDSQDADDSINFAADDVAGFNVNAIAIEVPITLLTQDGRVHSAGESLATIGAWGTTSRSRSNGSGTDDSDATVLNISYNGLVEAAGIIPGFIVERKGTVALTAESLAGAQPGMPNPTLALRVLGGSILESNDDCNDMDIENIIGRPLATPRDACVVIDLDPGAYVAEVRDGSSMTGNVLFSALAKRSGGMWTQVQRMANPLFNELIIGTGDKDRFSTSHPADDAQFADYALDPLLARVLNAVYDAIAGPGALPIPEPPRTDLLPLVQYLPPIAAPDTPPGPVADLLRLNTGVAPTPMVDRHRLGLLGGDVAGYPNGRRVSDDVTDIAARVVAGVLAGAPFNGFPHNRIGDGVNVNDAPYRETFPYQGLAHSGRDSRHVDPGEIGCTDFCP